MNSTRITYAVEFAAALRWVLCGTSVASGETAQPGQQCSPLHATAVAPDGRTLTCNQAMTGIDPKPLFWQFGGPR